MKIVNAKYKHKRLYNSGMERIILCGDHDTIESVKFPELAVIAFYMLVQFDVHPNLSNDQLVQKITLNMKSNSYLSKASIISFMEENKIEGNWNINL